MSAVLKACLDFYSRFSTPETLEDCHFAEAIKEAADQEAAEDFQGDTLALAETLEDCLWDLGAELPEDGWTWLSETHSDLEQAQALMVQTLGVLMRAHERERPRFIEWDDRTTREQIAATGNVVPIRR